MPRDKPWKPTWRQRRFMAQDAVSQLNQVHIDACSARWLLEATIEGAKAPQEDEFERHYARRFSRRIGRAVLEAIIATGTIIAVAEGLMPDVEAGQDEQPEGPTTESV